MKRLGVCVSLGAFLVRYVARVMSAKVHETAEISSLPGEERIHAAWGEQGRICTQKCTRARAYRALCTTHDRELAPPSAPVGQSSLLTHTRVRRVHTHARPPILYSYVHMAHRRDEKSEDVSGLSTPFCREFPETICLRIDRSPIECFLSELYA